MEVLLIPASHCKQREVENKPDAAHTGQRSQDMAERGVLDTKVSLQQETIQESGQEALSHRRSMRRDLSQGLHPKLGERWAASHALGRPLDTYKRPCAPSCRAAVPMSWQNIQEKCSCASVLELILFAVKAGG